MGSISLILLCPNFRAFLAFLAAIKEDHENNRDCDHDGTN